MFANGVILRESPTEESQLERETCMSVVLTEILRYAQNDMHIKSSVILRDS